MTTVLRSVGTVLGLALFSAALPATAQTTYYLNPLAAVNVGVDGSTNMTTLADLAVTGGSTNQNRGMTNTTAPTGTARWRVREGATSTRTDQEYLRAYTTVFASATGIAANATAYADFYMNTAGTAVTAKAALYEYNDTTGIVGAAKGTASFVGNATITTRQTMNDVSFGNAAFTIAAGNRLLVIYLFDVTAGRPAYLWGQTASATPSGHQHFTVTAGAATPNTTAAGIATASATAGTCNSITVSAPYTNDGNANNTLSYRYRTPTGTGAWVGPTARPHSASPYGFAITPLAAGTYDVEVTYVDADGVTGTATQTVSNIAVGLNCTAAGTVSAVANSCTQVTVSAPFTGDANANGTVAFSRGPAAGGPFTAVTGCAAVGGASPRSCIDTTVAGSSTYYYQAVYSDADGVTGTATQVTSAVSTPACVVPNVTTGTPTATVNSCTQITVSAPFTGDTNTNSSTTVERGATATGPWTAVCSGLTGASPRSCAASGLTNATPYYFRVTFTETAPDTVQGTNPQVIGPFTTQDCRVLPGVPTASASSCTTVNVSAPFSGDANANSTTTFSRGTSAGGPFTAVCSGVTGASPRACSDGGRTASTTYYYQVTFADADGVSGLNPQVTAGATTPACSVNNTTIGTVAATVASCNSVRVTATFTGDGDQDGTATIQYGATAAPGTWTDACVVSGPSPRQCTVPGLTASTLYSFRALFADADGVVGTNPTTGIQATTTACGGDTVPPTITLLAPSKNAVLAGIETVKVQVWDAVGVSAVLGQVDGTGPAGFTLAFSANANYSCGSGCAVYQYVLPAQTAGPHYFAVRAADAAGNAAVVTIPFRAVAATTGAGNLLRRTSGSQLCIDCHNIQTHNAQNTSTKYGSWASDCATCHTPHATTNIFLVRPQIDTPNSGRKNVDFRTSNGVAANGHATPLASGNGVNVCEVCHTQTKNSDSTPRARNNSPTDWTKHYTTACTGCHSHAKGFAAGESEGGVLCKGCHADIWNNMQPTAGKGYRHTLAIDSVTDDAVTWGNPLSANVPGARSCLNMCHFDHPHTAGAVVTHENNVYKDATSNASRAATTRDTVTKSKTDFDNAATNGGMCISCHRNPVESGANPAHPAVVQADYNSSAHNYTASALGTWQYGLHDGSQFDRNCTKCHAGSTEKTPSSTAIPFQAVHWNAEVSLLAGKTNPAGVAASNVCYNCHGNGTTGANYSNKTVSQDGTKTVNHRFDADTVHNSVTEFANAVFGNTLGVTGRHGNCLDCHEPHTAKKAVKTGTATSATTTTLTDTTMSGRWTASQWVGSILYVPSLAAGQNTRNITANTAAGVLTVPTWTTAPAAGAVYYILNNSADGSLQGAWGAQLSTFPAIWTAPAAGNFTKKTIVAGTDLEATLCFKCHSSYYWGGPPGVPPNGISPNGTVANPIETDVAMEFNPANKSGHPVLAGLTAYTGSTAPKPLTTGQMVAPWNGTAANMGVGVQTMTCSDCHTTDAASPAAQGPHGSAAAFMIKGGAAKPGWPTAVASSAGFATTFCSNCHANASIHTTDGAHSTNCYKCHIVIPHGGKMSRLMASSAAGTTMPTRYAYSGVLSNVWITKFTKSATYSETNCGTNNSACTGKHPATNGTETW